MKNQAIAKRYARALFMISKQKKSEKGVLEEISTINDAIRGDLNLKDYFANPLISPDQKKETLKKALSTQKLDEDVLNTLCVMAEKNRIGQLAEVAEQFKVMMNEADGVTEGIIKSAVLLAPNVLKEMEETISKTIKKKITLVPKIDSTLLGGAIAHVGGWTFDASLETQLKKMNEELKRRSN